MDEDHLKALLDAVVGLTDEVAMVRGQLIAESALTAALCITHPDGQHLVDAFRESTSITRDALIATTLSEVAMKAFETYSAALLHKLHKFAEDKP